MVVYRKATLNDIPQLIKFRMALLQSTIKEDKSERWHLVEEQTMEYYQKALLDKTHIAYLAYDNEFCIGTGGICFYRILPTYYKPTGEKAFIINMYTEPEYRRQGIATEILDRLVAESLKRGVAFITLEATNMGRPVYEKYGFGAMKSEMQFINETYEN